MFEAGKMKRTLIFATAAAVISMLTAAPAESAVMFEFHDTGGVWAGPGNGAGPKVPMPDGTFAATGHITITDEAYAQGIAVQESRRYSAIPISWFGKGILDISFGVLAPGGASLSADLGDFVHYPPDHLGLTPTWTINLVSDAFGMPTGNIRYNNNETDWNFMLSGSASTLYFNSDRLFGPCNGGCDMTGVFAQTTAVPEPGTWALLTLPMLILFGLTLNLSVHPRTFLS
jgi:hypothetical protein